MLELPKARLVCGPLAVIEFDPAVLATLARAFGAQKLQVYDIEPWTSDPHPIYGVVCLVSKMGR